MTVFVVPSLLGVGSFVLLTCAGVLVYRRYFACVRKAAPAAGASAGTERDAGKGGAGGQTKVLNDVISWVSSYPQRQIDEWADVCTRALTQHATTQKSQEDFQIRFEKIVNAEGSPRLSKLSTEHNVSKKSLVIGADVYWKRFELVLSVTPRRTHNAVCSINCHVVVFEFQAAVEGVFLTSHDGSILTVKFQKEPKMTIEVKPNQGTDVDIVKLERLIRDVISGTDVCLPVSSFSEKTQKQEQLDKQLTSAENQLPRNVADQRRKLLVKIVKANGLVTTQEKDYGSRQPFCIAQLDSPVQMYITSSVKNTTNPFFDEQIVFDLDQTTKKLTFEVRDKDRPEYEDFLGMAALTADDFVRTRHVLPLTGRGPTTYGALTVELTVIDSDQLPSILSLNPSVQQIPVQSEADRRQVNTANRQIASTKPGISTPSGFPTLVLPEAEVISLPSLTPTGTATEFGSREVVESRSSTLPPRGDQKKKSSLVGAIKKRFQRNKPGSRSESAERSADKQSLGEGTYLTPTPSRASASTDYGEYPDDAGTRSGSNSVRSSLRRIFRLKRKDESPTRLSGRGYNPTPGGSVGQPSPRLRSSSSSRGSPMPPAAGGTTPRVQER